MGAELQVNGMDVVDSESDQEMGESTDEEEDEPDFVDVEEEADMSREIPKEPQSGAPSEEQTMSSHIAMTRQRRRQLKDLQIPPIPFQKKGRGIWLVICRTGDGAPYA